MLIMDPRYVVIKVIIKQVGSKPSYTCKRHSV